MDPTKALEEIRERLAELSRDVDNGSLYHEGVQELLEMVSGLDEWLSTGGFLPKAWERKYKVPTPEEAVASGIHGEDPSCFAMRVATAITNEMADQQKRILTSLERSSKGVLLDMEEQMACVHLEALGLVAGGDDVFTDYGDWRYYFATDAGKALVEYWRKV